MLRYSSPTTGKEHTTCCDVEVQRDAVVATPPAIAKGMLLQRFVEACRECLMAAELRNANGTGKLRQALGSARELLAEVDAAPQETDALCPSLRSELRDFVEMVEQALPPEKPAPACCDQQVMPRELQEAIGSRR